MARKTEKRNCLYCEKEFDSPMSQIKKGKGYFCSVSCGLKNRRPSNNVNCALCNKDFYVKPSRMKISKSGLYFCSRAHKNAAQRLENGIPEILPNHYGDGFHSSTYRRIAFDHYEKKCNHCGFDQHPSILEVHHKDRNRKNNKPKNLEVLCPNCHRIHHFLEETGRYSKKIKKMEDLPGDDPGFEV